jgi:HK97 family phage major capsid protein
MSKQVSISELREEHGRLTKRLEELHALHAKEGREATEEEATEMRNARQRCGEIHTEVTQRGFDLAMEKIRVLKPESGGGEVRLTEVVKSLLSGDSYPEHIDKMNKRGRELITRAGHSAAMGRSICIPLAPEERATFTAGGNAGQNLIQTEFLDILPALRDRLVLTQAGATLWSGLRSNIEIPTYSGSTSNWAGENTTAEDGGGTFGNIKMSPKRLASKLYISQLLLVQDELNVEAYLRNDLLRSVTGKLEATVLSADAHADVKPDGLFTGFTDAPKEINWSQLVGLETKVDAQNAALGKLAYVMHTQLYGATKCIPKFSASPLLEADGSLNTYGAYRTNAVATAAVGDTGTKYGIIFGNWEDLLIGQWGVLELTVDGITKAEEATTRLIVNTYWDVKARRDASFAKAWMTLPASLGGGVTSKGKSLLGEIEDKLEGKK